MDLDTEVLNIASNLAAEAKERKESLSYGTALLAAAQIQQTRILKKALVVSDSDSHPSAPELIAMALDKQLPKLVGSIVAAIRDSK